MFPGPATRFFEAALGPPDKKVDLGYKLIYIYSRKPALAAFLRIDSILPCGNPRTKIQQKYPVSHEIEAFCFD